MSTELSIFFHPQEWYPKNKNFIFQKLKLLSSYNGFHESEKAICLKSPQNLDWKYDIRFFEEADYIFFEISHHDEVLKSNLIYFLNGLELELK